MSVFRCFDPFEEAVWIAGNKECQSPVFFRRFNVSGIVSAKLMITGLGYFEACVNGRAVTDKKFIPVVSDYEKRDLRLLRDPLTDTTTNRIYYYEFDVAGLIADGENILSIQLGNGFYREKERIDEGQNDFGEILKTIYRLELVDLAGKRCICSDGSEVWQESEITYNNIFVGEIIDPAAIGNTFKKVQMLPKTDSVFTPSMGSDDRVISTVSPTLVCTVDGRNIYDVGINISGVVRLKTRKGYKGKIKLTFAENLNDDGTLNTISTGAGHRLADARNQVMTDIFVCDGEERYFEPKFVWHAFRYFEVDGTYDEVEVLGIHSDVDVCSTFDSSFEGLNFLYDAFIRTQLNNMHGSIPMDCPHRERLGYTGDGQVCSQAGMLLLDSQDFYRKWIRDIFDSQDKTSGHVQHTAPLMGGGGGPGGWGCAAIIVPYNFYRRFGDTDILKEYYKNMQAWLNYLSTRTENGLVAFEEKGGWCLGDWCTLEKTVLPEPYVNSCYYIKCLQLMCEIAHAIGKTDDVISYQTTEQTVKNAVCREYRDLDSGLFCGGVQGADAYAVWCGLAGTDTARKLSEKYDRLGHFDTGFLGTDILMEVLFTYGFNDTAYKLLQGEEKGSFLYMKRHGATTVWETWGGGNSHDHPMFGACVRQLFSSVLGILNDDGAAGYTNIVISPCLPSGDGYARGSIKTINGIISVEWNKCGNCADFVIKIPKNTVARFCMGEKETNLSEENQFSITL